MCHGGCTVSVLKIFSLEQKYATQLILFSFWWTRLCWDKNEHRMKLSKSHNHKYHNAWLTMHNQLPFERRVSRAARMDDRCDGTSTPISSNRSLVKSGSRRPVTQSSMNLFEIMLSTVPTKIEEDNVVGNNRIYEWMKETRKTWISCVRMKGTQTCQHNTEMQAHVLATLQHRMSSTSPSRLIDCSIDRSELIPRPSPIFFYKTQFIK